MSGDWPVVRLDEVAEVRLGRQRSPKNHDGDNMVPYLRAANVTALGLSIDDVKTMHFTPDEVKTFALEPGDVLVAEASGSPLEVGKSALWAEQLPGPICFQNTLLRVRARPIARPAFLRLILEHQRLEGTFAQASQGVGIHHLTSRRLAALAFPLPPLAVQDTVVAKAEEVSTVLGAVSTAHLRLVGLMRSLRASLCLQLARGSGLHANLEPVPGVLGLRAPGSWTRCSLGRLIAPGRVAAYGVLQPGDHVPGGVPLVRVSDVGSGRVAVTGLKRISHDIAAEYQRTALRGGELLVTLVGSVGRTGVVPDALKGANTARAVGVLPLAESVNAQFVSLLLEALPYQQALTAGAHEVARKTLNLGTLKEFVVALPEPAEQDELIRRIQPQLDELERMHAVATALGARAQGMTLASLRQLLRGQVKQPETTQEAAT